jgi:hypothetical protein
MRKLVNYWVLGVFLIAAVMVCAPAAHAAPTLKSIVASPTTITITQNSQSVAINAIAVIERGTGTNPGDTDAVVISWGIQTGGASYGGGSINIGAGLNNTVGTGTANFTVSPGIYTVYASMGAANTTGNTITVTSNSLPTPTQPAVITQVESDPIPATASLIYRKTEVKVFGTCQFSGQTMEIQLDGSVVGSVMSTGTNWAYTVTVPADDNFHTVTVITGANLTSNSASVKVDITAPQFNITYDPSAMPFSAGTVRITMTVTEPVSTAAADTTLNIIPPNGVGIPLTLTPMPAGAYAQTFTTTMLIGKNAANKPTINGGETQDGSFTMYAVARDQAKPGGNLGTVIQTGGSFTINVSGPSSAGARVSIASDAQYTNSRTLNFTWQGFTHSLGVDRLSKYWYIAAQTPPANADTADTNLWKDGGAGANGGGNGSLSVTGEGTWEVYVKAQDALGNFSTSAKDSIIVDTIGPNLVGGSQVPPSGFANGTDQTEILCSIQDLTSGIDRNTAVMTVNGTQYGVGGTSAPNASPAVSCVTTGTPGTYQLIFRPQLIGLKYPRGTVTVSVTANDMVGNPLGGTAGSPGSPATWSFVVNTNADSPLANQPQPAAGFYYNAKRPTISLHLDDSDLIDRSSVVMNISNGSSYMTFNVGSSLVLTDAPAGGTDSVLTLTPPMDFVDGTVSVTVSAKDRIGNVMTPYPWTFYVDTTPPVASNPVPANNTVVTTMTPVISGKLYDAGAGLDTSTDSVRLRINYIALSNPASSFSREFTIDSATEPGLTYNASTQTLSFNPTMANNFTFGVGSVEVVLVTARDRAVSPPAGTAPLPNVLAAPYQWSFSISTSAGPVVSFGESTPKPPTSATEFSYTNIEPLIIRTTLVDDDLINHSSLLIDINGRTFRDGDAQVSWQTGTTNEVLIVNLQNETTLIKQGTNSVSLRAASDRTGRALQNAPVDLSFLYDNVGPVASSPTPADGGIIYDLTNGVVKCKLSDVASGVARASLEVRDNGSLIGTYGTDSTPVNLVYDGNAQDLVFRTSTPYTAGHNYQFTLIPPTAPGAAGGTVDKAGNGLGKAANSSATAPFSWTLTAASTSDVVLLVSPENDAFVNVIDKDFAFMWRALHGATMYRLEISGNLSFTDTYKYDTTSTSFTNDTLQTSLMEHGKIYYWQVSALNSSGQVYGTSERRQFTVDNLAPQMPKIVGVIDYLGLNPKHENSSPTVNTTYVKQRRVRVKVLLYEGAPSTVGYTISVGYLQIINGTSTKYIELGEKTDVHGYDTNEVDITFPDQDGEYRVVAYVLDRAGNMSPQCEQARVYVNRKIPKINTIILTDPSPNSNGYITSGKVKFEVQFNTPIDMLPLRDYTAKPSIKFDPKSADGTSPIELTDLTVSGKSVTGYASIPYGQGAQFDGMADVIVTGFMDASWNTMDGGSVTYYKYFEIDTAPGFVVKTFLNPVDEKNVLINIQASETMLFSPACYITVANGDVDQRPVYIMAKNLYAVSTTGTVGENNIRISGLDTRNNIGYWPTADVIKEGRFLMAEYNPNKESVIGSRDMGVSVEIPKRAISRDANIYVFPYRLEYVGNDYLAKVSQSAPKSPARMAAAEGLKASGETMRVKTDNGKMMMVSYSGSGQAEVKVEDAAAEVKGEKQVQSQPKAELEQVSSFFDISPSRGLRTSGKIAIDCVLTDAQKADLSKMGVYYSSDGILWERAGGKFDGSKFEAEMKATGVYGVFTDNKEPMFSKQALDGRTNLDSTRPELFAYVSDFGSGIDADNVIVRIDGVPYKASYNEKESKISYCVEEGLKAGNHEIVFEAADHSGNISRQAVQVIAPAADPDIINAISYPNPARRGSNPSITFTVSGSLGNMVDAKIYIYDINANRVTELTPMQTGNNFRAIWAGMVNDDGEIVANGVYFYKIKVNCADKSVEKYGKIAVLR